MPELLRTHRARTSIEHPLVALSLAYLLTAVTSLRKSITKLVQNGHGDCVFFSFENGLYTIVEADDATL
eukprot:5771587-Amphidinium_carterae.1